MRKLLLLIVALAMLLCAAGCGSASNAPDSAATVPPTTPRPTPGSLPDVTPAVEAPDSSASANRSGSKEKVTCSMCNGTGKVRYYYGGSATEAALNGKNDYEYGPCTSCGGTGYTYVTVSGSPSSSNKVTCPSCGKKVDRLISRKDAAGVTRNWCSSCWADYDAIMG